MAKNGHEQEQLGVIFKDAGDEPSEQGKRRSGVAGFVSEYFCPVILIGATETARQSAKRRKLLSVSELFKPFERMENINVPVRTVGEAAYRLRFFRVRFMESWEMQQVTPPQAEKYLVDLLSMPEWKDDLKKYTVHSPSVDDLLEAASTHGRPPTPWTYPYLRSFLKVLRFSEHESFDHPVASICVIGSDSESPVGEAISVQKTDVPPLMAHGYMDTNILRHYLLLHDLTSPNRPSNERLGAIFAEMQTAFGATAVSVVNIGANGIENGEAIGKAEFWKTIIREPVPYLKLLNYDIQSAATIESTEEKEAFSGEGFNLQDGSQMNKFVAKFSVKTLLPYLEQRVRSLHFQVSSTRKGLRNQLKSFWTGRRHDHQDSSPSRNGNNYAAASPEAQLRILGDLAVMLGDYELALSHYKLLAGDYKQDRAWKRMAGVQEAIGLCHLILSESPGKRGDDREAEMYFESAADNYVAAENSPGASRYATRSMVFLAEGLRARNLHGAATSAYLSAALAERKHTNAVRAAILLEQAAWSHLRCDPPLVRKASFHMVLAAHRFNVGSLRLHSRHAYASISGLYDQGWHHIDEHISFCLARLCGHLGEPTSAISHFLELLSGPSVGPQQTYLNEFLLMVRQAASLPGQDDRISTIGDGTEKNPLCLRLPDVTPHPKMINFADIITYATPDAAAVKEEEWTDLEASMIGEATPAYRTPTWLELANGTGSLTLKLKEFNCVVNEEISIDVQLRNTLKLPLQVSNLRLECSYLLDSDSNETVAPEISSVADFDTIAESLALEPNETVVARLRVIPRRTGGFKVHGVAWILEGVAHGRCDLQNTMSTTSKSAEGGRQNSTHSELLFKVSAPMPLLSAKVIGIPLSIQCGGICQVSLVLVNRSDVHIRRLRIRFDTPSLMLNNHSEENKSNAVAESDIFEFNERILRKNEEVHIPLWIHAPNVEGLHKYLAAIVYEAENCSSNENKYRILRMSGSFYVTPSIVCSANLIHGLAGGYPGRTRMKFCVRNNSGSLSFKLRQIHCKSATWILKPLPGDVSAASGVIRAGDCWNLLFHLAIRENRDSEEHESSITIQDDESGQELPFAIKSFHSRAEVPWEPVQGDSSSTPERCSVILFWEQYGGSPNSIETSNTLGAHHLFNIHIPSGPPVRAWMTGPSVVSHNFSGGGPCNLPVTLHIHNRAMAPLTVLMEAGPDLSESRNMTEESSHGWVSQTSGGKKENLSTSKYFVWRGGTRRKLQGLAPGEDRSLSMEAAVYVPGIIELKGYRLLWAMESASPAGGAIVGESFLVEVIDTSTKFM